MGQVAISATSFSLNMINPLCKSLLQFQFKLAPFMWKYKERLYLQKALIIHLMGAPQATLHVRATGSKNLWAERRTIRFTSHLELHTQNSHSFGKFV